MKPVAFILPPRERFSAESAGAIATVVQRLAGAVAGAVVLGAPLCHCKPQNSAAIQSSFSRIRYAAVTNPLALIRVLRRLQPRGIEVHQQPRLALALALLFPRTKIMLFLHNDPLTMRGLKTRAARRLMLRRLHRVVCVSEYLAARYMTGLTGTGPAVLPNPITLSELPARKPVREQNILFAGRVVADKGPDVFVAACALALPMLPGWRAMMMGGDRFGPSSPETDYVKQIQRAAQGSGVGFAGYRPHAEVLAAMAAAAIVVVPSRWAEPFGLAALEACASGAALIATDVGGLTEVAGGAAVYVAPDDAVALAAAMVGLARDPAARAALGEAGLARAERFNTPVIAAALEKLRQTG